MGSLSEGQAKLLDLIADHQLEQRSEISGKRLRVAMEQLGVSDGEMNALIDFFVLPVSWIQPNDSYKLALWGWARSKYHERVLDLLGAVLSTLKDKFKVNPDFTHYSWDELRERLPSLDDSQRYFVNEILWPRLSGGEDSNGWRVPWDVEEIRKLTGSNDLARYAIERDVMSRIERARAQRRVDWGFALDDESADDLIDIIEGGAIDIAQPSLGAADQGAIPEVEAAIDFAIVTAIEVERRAVCKVFGLTHRVRKGSRVYWRGAIPLKSGGVYELVVAQGLDAANVDAAILTNDLIHHFRPHAALMIGIAASAKSEQAMLGDVVVGGEVYYYERGKETSEGRLPEPKIIPADATLWSSANAVPDWDGDVPVVRPGGSRARSKVHYGIIASGEKVIASIAKKERITSASRKILAIEMEGYGFSRAVWQSAERVRHLDIRGISDDGGPAKDDQWHEYAAAAAAQFAKHLLLDEPLQPRNRARAGAGGLVTSPLREPWLVRFEKRLERVGLRPAGSAEPVGALKGAYMILTKPNNMLMVRFQLAPSLLVLCTPPGGTVTQRDIESTEQVIQREVDIDRGVVLVVSDDEQAEARLESTLPEHRRYLFVRGDVFKKKLPKTFLSDLLRSGLSQRRFFDARTPAEQAQFFGRERELEALERRIRNGASVGVFGLRKIGKTSLVKCLVGKLKQEAKSAGKVFPVMVDLQLTPYNRSNLEGLLALLDREVVDQSKRANVQVPKGSDGLDRLRSLVLAARSNGTRVLLILDEYEILLGANGVPVRDGILLLAQLRGLAQQYQGNFGLMLVGRDQGRLEPARIEGFDNPMYRFLETFPVTGLEPKDCVRMFRKLGGYMELHFNEEATSFIVQETGGHPMLMRTLGDLVDQTTPLGERPKEITPAVLKRLFPRFSRDTGQDMREIVDAAADLHGRARDYLVHIAHGLPWIGGPVEARIQELLQGFGIMAPGSDALRIGCLQRWIRENYQTPPEVAHG